MTRQRIQTTHTRRDSWVEVNLSHIEHNCRQVRKFIGKDTKIMAVVKADAYGHGADMVTPVMQASGIDSFGVASIDEGIHLRNSAITKDILVLGPPPVWALDSALEHHIAMTIFHEDHAYHCSNIAQKHNTQFPIHIKIDIGMHRIGTDLSQALEFIHRIQQMEYLNLQGIFSHFPCAEDRDITQKEQEAFNQLINKIDHQNTLIHVANSMAAIKYPDTYYDMVRVGIILYGLYPDGQDHGLNLKQAMALRGRVTHICTLQKNEGISYGHTYSATHDHMKVATIPIGYADGVSRSLSNKIQGSLNGYLVKQVGTITMDQMMFDISDIDNVKLGNVITLLGQDGNQVLSIDDWANKLNTINYEITCRLKVRLPRVFSR